MKLNEYGILFELNKGQVNIAVIASDPYMYMKTVCESTTLEDAALMQLEDWCYDILLGDRLVEMMPEDFLELMKEDKEE